jgi:prepilin-type N-terminal cleavage/methylation domain-containing protein
MSARRRKQGFTLLELLVAMLVLVVITIMVHMTFASVTDTMAAARDESDRLLVRQALHRSLKMNLASVYADQSCLMSEFAFLGETGDGAFGPADTLRFVAALPMPGAYALPGEMKVVEYALVPESDLDWAAMGYPGDPERPAMALVISEYPVQRQDDLGGDLSGTAELPVSERAVPVASFDVQFFDGMTEEWLTDWDSLAEQRLPWAVWVRVNFPRGTEEAPPVQEDGGFEAADLDVMIPLAPGAGLTEPFPDKNHMRAVDWAETDQNLTEDTKRGARK